MRDFLTKQRECDEIANDAVRYEPPSMKKTLIIRRNALREELNRIDAAITLFETEPRVTDALEVIMKAMR